MKSVAAANTASMFQDIALIGALAERHFVDPATRLCRAAREHHKTVGEGVLQLLIEIIQVAWQYPPQKEVPRSAFSDGFVMFRAARHNRVAGSPK